MYSPVESKSPSNGLSGLVMLFLFDGECFKAATQNVRRYNGRRALVHEKKKEHRVMFSRTDLQINYVKYAYTRGRSKRVTLQKLTSVP